MRKGILWNQRGAALIEFAIALPLIVVTVIGLIELARFTFYGILVGNAAHAGAQYGAQSFTTAANGSGMQSAALNDGQNAPGITIPTAGAVCACWNGTTLTPSPPSGSCTSPTPCPSTSPASVQVTYVHVTASGTISTLLHYPGFPASYSVTRDAYMRVRAQQ